MQNLQDFEVTLQFAREREMALRRGAPFAGSGVGRTMRSRLGRQLVRTGTWLAIEQPMRPEQAG